MQHNRLLHRTLVLVTTTRERVGVLYKGFEEVFFVKVISNDPKYEFAMGMSN